jgi:hypothetical protein
MGVQDLDARFDAVKTSPGSIAEQAVAAVRKAAAEINDRVHGEPYQLVTFIQAMEVAAHQAATYLDFQPDRQPGLPQGDPAADEGYEGLTVNDLKAAVAERNETRPEDQHLPVTGTKAELVARLELDDSQRAEQS